MAMKIKRITFNHSTDDVDKCILLDGHPFITPKVRGQIDARALPICKKCDKDPINIISIIENDPELDDYVKLAYQCGFVLAQVNLKFGAKCLKIVMDNPEIKPVTISGGIELLYNELSRDKDDVNESLLAVNSNLECSDFGNLDCSDFGIKSTVIPASRVQCFLLKLLLFSSFINLH